MKRLSIGILLSLITFAGSVSANDERFHPNHLFVKMKAGKQLVKSPLIQSSKRIIKNLYLVESNDISALEVKLTSSSQVEYVQKDFYAGKMAMPKLEPMDIFAPTLKGLEIGQFNDPRVGELWAFGEAAGMSVLKPYEALPQHTAEEIIVAVVDTGVDHDHEDLKDVMWTNAGEIPADGIDNDGNGYIDDIHGINTLIRDEQGRATMNTMASHWHGTHVSGTIAATQNNGIGIAGVANNVKIMAIRTVPDDADELDSDIVEAYQYAAKNGARIINCSFGKAKNEGGMVVRDVINEIGREYNVLVIASAGNDSKWPLFWHNNDSEPKYPASFDSENLLVVASTDSNGTFSSFSNIGPKTVDVAAPGRNILSTVNNSNYSSASGTSMASPNTSGVAAMVLGFYPQLTAIQLKKVLMDSVTKVSSFESKLVSGGRVNLPNSLKAAAKIQ